MPHVAQLPTIFLKSYDQRVQKLQAFSTKLIQAAMNHLWFNHIYTPRQNHPTFAKTTLMILILTKTSWAPLTDWPSFFLSQGAHWPMTTRPCCAPCPRPPWSTRTHASWRMRCAIPTPTAPGPIPWMRRVEKVQRGWSCTQCIWYIYIYNDSDIPVVPRKAVAEVSNIGNQTYRRGWLLWITDGRANPLMDRQVVGVVFFGVVAMVVVVALPQLLDVVWCSAVVVAVVAVDVV